MGRILKSEEDRNRRRIEMLAGEQLTASEIAEILGISPATVYRYRDKFDIAVPEGKKGRKSGPKDDGQRFEEKVQFLARAGASVSYIASKLDVPPAVVIAIAKKHDIAVEDLN